MTTNCRSSRSLTAEPEPQGRRGPRATTPSFTIHFGRTDEPADTASRYPRSMPDTIVTGARNPRSSVTHAIGGMQMADPTAEVLRRCWAQRGYEPLLAHASGSDAIRHCERQEDGEAGSSLIDKGKLIGLAFRRRCRRRRSAPARRNSTVFVHAARRTRSRRSCAARSRSTAASRLIVQFRRILTGQRRTIMRAAEAAAR